MTSIVILLFSSQSSDTDSAQRAAQRKKTDMAHAHANETALSESNLKHAMMAKMLAALEEGPKSGKALTVLVDAMDCDFCFGVSRAAKDLMISSSKAVSSKDTGTLMYARKV